MMATLEKPVTAARSDGGASGIPACSDKGPASLRYELARLSIAAHSVGRVASPPEMEERRLTAPPGGLAAPSAVCAERGTCANLVVILRQILRAPHFLPSWAR